MSAAAWHCPLRYPLPSGGGPPRAVFLDRDGVLVPDLGYLADPDRLTLLPGVGAALRLLRSAGWQLIVVTNQSGIARGRFTLARLDAIHARLCELFAVEGVALDALYYCPHHPEGSVAPFAVACAYRKPAPGMLLAAARDCQLELDRCWLIGDQERDIFAAIAAGCRAIRIGSEPVGAVACAPDLPAAVTVLLDREKAGRAGIVPSTAR